MSKALAVCRKELRQISRDRRTLLILVFVPAFFLLLYGYALNFDIRHVPLAVEDRDGSPESRALVSAFINSGYFDLQAAVYAPRTPNACSISTTRSAVLVIPEGFARETRAGRLTPVQVIISGENANTATTVMGYAGSILRTAGAPATVGGRVGTAAAVRRAADLVQPRAAQHAVPRPRTDRLHRHDHGGRSRRRSRSCGRRRSARWSRCAWRRSTRCRSSSARRFRTSSFRSASAALIIGASMVLFGLPMRGNWLSLLVALSLFLVGALGTGLLISTVADTQQVAFQLALLISFLPTIMLSGFIFPICSMPTALQLITYVVPARYFLIALRGIVLKGTAADAAGAAAGGAGGVCRCDADARVGAAWRGTGVTVHCVACSASAFSSGRNSWSCGRIRGCSGSSSSRRSSS